MRFEHVLNVGDVGIWPDRRRMDKATRNHGGPGDFADWLEERRAVPQPTVFVKGNHEDFIWLEEQRGAGVLEVLPGLLYLRNGEVVAIEADGERLAVGGIGGCFGPSDYERPANSQQSWSQRHFTRDEVSRIADHGSLDVLLHDAPAGVAFTFQGGQARPGGKASPSSATHFPPNSSGGSHRRWFVRMVQDHPSRPPEVVMSAVEHWSPRFTQSSS